MCCIAKQNKARKTKRVYQSVLTLLSLWCNKQKKNSGLKRSQCN